MKKLNVIKVGGNIIDNESALMNFLNDLSHVKDAFVLVHGGGKSANDIAKRLGLSQAMVNGRRITDGKTLKVTTMVYAGLINKTIVAGLQSKGVNAFGLSGADGNSLQTVLREVKDIDYGFVGDLKVDSVNVDFISGLLELGLVPVFSAITHDGKGQLLNTNADTIASALAAALSEKFEVNLIYTFEKNGVLKNVEDESSVIPKITKTLFKQMSLDGSISKGMLPKLENAFASLDKGVNKVLVAGANEVLNAINETNYGGTTIIA